MSVSTVEIPKAENYRDAVSRDGPRWWKGSRGEVLTKCGACGQASVLLPHDRPGNHTVAPDGTVSPSILTNCCGWHVFARLLNWDGAA